MKRNSGRKKKLTSVYWHTDWHKKVFAYIFLINSNGLWVYLNKMKTELEIFDRIYAFCFTQPHLLCQWLTVRFEFACTSSVCRIYTTFGWFDTKKILSRSQTEFYLRLHENEHVWQLWERRGFKLYLLFVQKYLISEVKLLIMNPC